LKVWDLEEHFNGWVYNYNIYTTLTCKKEEEEVGRERKRLTTRRRDE
jgi:hypothetical protein